jgi:hypothetical protein
MSSVLPGVKTGETKHSRSHVKPRTAPTPPDAFSGRAAPRPPTLAGAVHQALAQLGRQLQNTAIKLAAHQIPSLRVLAEASEVIIGSLRLLVEVAGSTRGVLHVYAYPGPAGEVLLVMRFHSEDVAQAARVKMVSGSEQVFNLAMQTGCQLICQCDYPVTTMGLRLRQQEAMAAATWA